MGFKCEKCRDMKNIWKHVDEQLVVTGCECVFDDLLQIAFKKIFAGRPINTDSGTVSHNALHVLTKVKEAFLDNRFPNFPLAFFGTAKNWLDFQVSLLVRLKDLAIKFEDKKFLTFEVVSLRELTDLYFVDSVQFHELITQPFLFVLMGDEVPNQGVVKVLDSLLLRFNSSFFYPVLFSGASSKSVLVKSYPAEATQTLNKFLEVLGG
jgi:hypothetical protein